MYIQANLSLLKSVSEKYFYIRQLINSPIVNGTTFKMKVTINRVLLKLQTYQRSTLEQSKLRQKKAETVL